MIFWSMVSVLGSGSFSPDAICLNRKIDCYILSISLISRFLLMVGAGIPIPMVGAVTGGRYFIDTSRWWGDMGAVTGDDRRRTGTFHRWWACDFRWIGQIGIKSKLRLTTNKERILHHNLELYLIIVK